jgi:O-antigen/teichoic acid export membrane protein
VAVADADPAAGSEHSEAPAPAGGAPDGTRVDRDDHPPASEPGRGVAQNTWWVLASTPVTGITTYLLLVVTARAIGPDAFGDFGVFWAASIISGLGVFLPLEQETTRRGSGRASASIPGLWRRATKVALVAAVVCSGLALAAWPLYASLIDFSVGLVVAYVVGIVGNLMQFPSRGVLASLRRFRDYGLVVVVESVARAVAVIALAWLGRDAAAAYALAVGFAALGSGIVAVILARRAIAAQASAGTAATAERFGRDGLRLVLAASAMQTILNSGTIVAKVVAPAAQSALAGQLTATLTLARLPVLVVQSIQSTYLSRLAARWHAHDVVAVRALLRVIAAAVLVVTAGLVVGAATIGPWVMSVVFGTSYVTDRTTVVLVALGVGIYLIASVSTDAGIALGLHTMIVAAWLAAVPVAVLMVMLAPSMVTAATLPLIGGALVAAAVLARPLMKRAAAPVDR